MRILVWATVVYSLGALATALAPNFESPNLLVSYSPPKRWAKPAPQHPAFRTALRSSGSIARWGRIIEGGETIDEEWR